MNIVLVAGEASGDQLGAALIRAIRLKEPDIQFAGIGGPLMKAEGCECWWDTSVLSLMGLVEVISHLPRLIKLRRQLVQRVVAIETGCFHWHRCTGFQSGCGKKTKGQVHPGHPVCQPHHLGLAIRQGQKNRKINRPGDVPFSV